MVEFRWMQMLLFGILVLRVAAAATSKLFLAVGAEAVTLSCETAIKDQVHCEATTWIFTDSGSRPAVELIIHGKIGKYAKSKSGRLRVAANCSLVIEKVSVEDAGRYDCQQYKERIKENKDTVVYLSLINMTGHKEDDEATLSCSVFTYKPCDHKVKWLLRGQDMDKHNNEIKTSQSSCSASVTVKTSHFIYISANKVLTCEVRDGNKVQVFPFRLQLSAETESTTTKLTGINGDSRESVTAIVEKKDDAKQQGREQDQWWFYITGAVVAAALLTTVVIIIKWRRTKGNKTQMNDNVVLTSNPAATQSGPETSQDTADPEDGVSYASVSYTKKPNSRAQARSRNDDDSGDAVTYTTVKASSPDPSTLYATII